MAPHSKFLELLEGNRQYLTEAKFVKGSEGSQLPPSGEEEEPETPEEEPTPSGEELPDDGGQEGQEGQEGQLPATAFTDKEQDILNVALQLYRANPDNPIEYKNDFSNMYDQGKYEQLLGRLIAVADEISD